MAAINGSGNGRDGELQQALRVMFTTLSQFKESYTRMQRQFDEQATTHKQEIGALQTKVRALESDIERIREIRADTNDVQARLSRAEARLHKLDGLDSLLHRLEALEAAQKTADVGLSETRQPKDQPSQSRNSTIEPKSIAAESNINSRKGLSVATDRTIKTSQGSRSMSRSSSASSGKRVSFVGNRLVTNGDNLEALKSPYDEFDLFERSLNGILQKEPVGAAPSGQTHATQEIPGGGMEMLDKPARMSKMIQNMPSDHVKYVDLLAPSSTAASNAGKVGRIAYATRSLQSPQPIRKSMPSSCRKLPNSGHSRIARKLEIRRSSTPKMVIWLCENKQ